LATGVGTLVVLMAVKNLDTLVSRLIENGKSPETPVAVVRWGTRPDQQTIVSTLGEIVSEVKEREIKPPAVVVVGEVVRLRETLQWYEDKPLFGQRVLVTREHASGFEPLEEMGAEILEFPTIEIVPPENYEDLDRAIEHISSYHWLIFTSANGVRFFLRRCFDRGRDIRDLAGIRICAIGTKTAAEIGRFGMKVDLMPEEFRAEGLIEAFSKTVSSRKNSTLGAQNTKLFEGLKFLLPRAETAREVFPETLKARGGEIDVPVAYRAVKPELHGRRLKRFLKEGRVTIATFTSAATFTNFLEIMGEDALELLKGVSIAVIGPVTAKAVEKAGLTVEIMPREATIEAMVEEIIRKKALR
ncbi:MAG TPA: uroporphyrinogen-III synthase, partial [Dissulfurispiraceae bacterium]